MDGPAAARAIRALGVKIPIFGVTGNGSEEDVQHFISHGATEVSDHCSTHSHIATWSYGHTVNRIDHFSLFQSSIDHYSLFPCLKQVLVKPLDVTVFFNRLKLLLPLPGVHDGVVL